MKPINETIAIYGGAFNPPTLGHSEVIEGVLESGIVDKIIFSPDGMRKDKNYGISPEKRTEIIEIFFSELKARHGDKIDISRFFMGRESSKATTTRQVDTYFRETLGYSPTHLFGSDVAPDMPDWLENENKFIEHELKKIFIQRPGYDFRAGELTNYTLLDIADLTEVSSSIVREMIQNRLTVDALLTPKVASHITENNISYN